MNFDKLSFSKPVTQGDRYFIQVQDGGEPVTKQFNRWMKWQDRPGQGQKTRDVHRHPHSRNRDGRKPIYRIRIRFRRGHAQDDQGEKG